MSDIPRRLAIAESRVDRAIDRAVRDMMHVDPRPGFRGRVFARLDPEPVRSTAFWRIGFAGVAVAVFALVIALGVWPRQTPRIDQEARTRSADIHLPTPQAYVAPAPPQAARNRTMPRNPPLPRVTGERITMPPIANVFGPRKNGLAASSVESDTLWPAHPAEAAQENRPDAPPPLVVPPLEPAAPIVIPPLNPRRPGGGL